MKTKKRAGSFPQALDEVIQDTVGLWRKHHLSYEVFPVRALGLRPRGTRTHLPISMRRGVAFAQSQRRRRPEPCFFRG
jgi:hypothetical protein